MTNITLTIDDALLDEVREIAAQRQTTVDAMVREYLTEIAAQESGIAEARRGLKELMDKSTARLGPDYVWNRDEIYEDRMFPRHQRPDLRGDGET